VALVGAADMLWSPGLVDRLPPAPEKASDTATPSGLTRAIELYTSGLEPTQWEQRRRGAAYLLKELNPPRDHREQWDLVASALEKASAPASAWQCWQRYSAPTVAHGLFGAYQNRLGGLRRAQLQVTAERLRPILERNDYAAYRESLSRLGDSSGPLWLALTLQPQSRVGRDDLLAYGWWWPVLMNQSNDQALQAGIRLAQGKSPDMPHRWEGRTCVCWSPGPDGRDDGGQIEAGREPTSTESVGDWIYRFR